MKAAVRNVFRIVLVYCIYCYSLWNFPQGLKPPIIHLLCSARLKPCPFKTSPSTGCCFCFPQGPKPPIDSSASVGTAEAVPFQDFARYWLLLPSVCQRTISG